MYFKRAIDLWVRKILVSLEPELIVLRKPNAWHHMETRSMSFVPIFTDIAGTISDSNVCTQSRDHRLTFPRRGTMGTSQRMLARNIIDLLDGMVKNTLKRKSKLDRIKVINIMVAMSQKTVSAWDHEAEVGVCIDGGRTKLVVGRPSVFALSNKIPHMRARKITMKCHVLGCKIVIPQSDYEAITEVAGQGRLTVIVWTPRIGWKVVCRFT